MKFVTEVPLEAGKVVSMIVHNGSVYVACEFGVWIFREGDGWEQLLSVPRPANDT